MPRRRSVEGTTIQTWTGYVADMSPVASSVTLQVRSVGGLPMQVGHTQAPGRWLYSSCWLWVSASLTDSNTRACLEHPAPTRTDR